MRKHKDEKLGSIAECLIHYKGLRKVRPFVWDVYFAALKSRNRWLLRETLEEEVGDVDWKQIEVSILKENASKSS